MTTPAGTFSYCYDVAGRPANMTNPFSEQTSWSYQNNNWLSTQTLANGATATYTYNALGRVTRLLNQISSSTISDFSSIAYDGVGNGTSLTFDPENRMTSYGSVLTAGYNGDGLRAWKQNPTARTYFLYDATNPVVELDASGNALATNTFDAAGFISRRTASPTVFYSFDSEGNVSQRTDASGSALSNQGRATVV